MELGSFSLVQYIFTEMNHFSVQDGLCYHHSAIITRYYWQLLLQRNKLRETGNDGTIRKEVHEIRYRVQHDPISIKFFKKNIGNNLGISNLLRYDYLGGLKI